MLIRRTIALSGVLIILGLVFSLDLRILTDRALARIRLKEEIARAFHHEAHFNDPQASLRGIHRVRDFRMRPSHGGYVLKAREIEVPFGIARQLIGGRPRTRAYVGGLDFTWRRGENRGWSFQPFLRFCRELQDSILLPVRLEDARIHIHGETPEEQFTVQLDEVEVKRVESGVQFTGSSSQAAWGRLFFNVTADTARGEFVGAVHFRSLQLRPDEFWLLPRRVSDVLEPLRARRSADLDLSLSSGGEIEVLIRPRNLSIRPETFPYPLRRISEGAILVRDDGATLRDLRGQSGPMRFQITGNVAPDEAYHESRLHLQWSEMPIDDTLAAAVPEEFGWIWQGWRPTGRVGGNVVLSPDEASLWSWQGAVDLREVSIPLPLPVLLDGRAAADYRDGVLAVDLTGVVLRLAGLPVGTIGSGEVRLDLDGFRVHARGRGAEGQDFTGLLVRSSEWPHDWRLELDLGGMPLGPGLAALVGEPRPPGETGRWSVTLRAGGREGEATGGGVVILHAPRGRRLPLLGEIFPPVSGRSEAVRGAASIIFERAGLRIPRIRLQSGAESAEGYGRIDVGGGIGLELHRSDGRGRPGPDREEFDLPGRGRARIEVGGRAGEAAVEIRAIPGREP